MLKRFLIIYVPITLCFTTLICYNALKVKDPKISDYNITDNIISMSIKEGTLTDEGATIIVTNKSDKNYVFSDSFYFEEKKDNIWYKFILPKKDLKSINIPVTTGSTYKELNVNSKATLTASWYDLSPGTYRIVKSFYQENDKLNEDAIIYVAVEFIVN